MLTLLIVSKSCMNLSYALLLGGVSFGLGWRWVKFCLSCSLIEFIVNCIIVYNYYLFDKNNRWLGKVD